MESSIELIQLNGLHLYFGSSELSDHMKLKGIEERSKSKDSIHEQILYRDRILRVKETENYSFGTRLLGKNAQK
jgi:hypothetical protein